MLLPCRFEIRAEQVQRSRNGHTTQIGPASAPDSQSSALYFSVADHEHKGNLCLLRFSNFKTDFFIPKVCFSSKSRSLELSNYLGNIRPLIVRDGHDHRLNRGKPGWKSAAEVFDENAEESFDRSHQSPMDHDRLVNLAVFPNIA